MRENAVCKGQKTLEVTELTADIITELTKAVPEKYELLVVHQKDGGQVETLKHKVVDGKVLVEDIGNDVPD